MYWLWQAIKVKYSYRKSHDRDAAPLWLGKCHYWIRTVAQNCGPTAVLFRFPSIRLHYGFLFPRKDQKESQPFRLFSLFLAKIPLHGPNIKVLGMHSELQAGQWAPFECCIPWIRSENKPMYEHKCCLSMNLQHGYISLIQAEEWLTTSHRFSPTPVS